MVYMIFSPYSTSIFFSHKSSSISYIAKNKAKYYMNSRLPLLTGSEFVKILRPIPMTQLSHHTEDRQCPLCTDTYESSDEVSCGLACGHFFHQGCIENWVSEKKAKKYTYDMCRRTLFAAFTHNTEQRRQVLIRSAINDARQQGVRSDIELYEVLRLRGSKMSPPNPQNAALGEAQDQRLTNELIYLDSFIFEMPAQFRDGAQWIVQLGGRYYGLSNISGFWKEDWVTIFPRRLLRYHLQRALGQGEDLKPWWYVIQEFLDPDLAQEKCDPDLVRNMIDDDMVQELLGRRLSPIVLDGNGLINPQSIDQNMVQFVLDRDLLQSHIAQRTFQEDRKHFVLTRDLIRKFMLRGDCLSDAMTLECSDSQ